MGTVSLAAAALIPALDVALKALALAGGGNVYMVAVREDVSLDDLAYFISSGIIELELAGVTVCLNAGLLEVAQHGLGAELFADGLEGYLNCFITIVLNALFLNYGAGTGKNYGHGDHGAVFPEHLGHAQLSAQNSFLHLSYTSVA